MSTAPFVEPTTAPEMAPVPAIRPVTVPTVSAPPAESSFKKIPPSAPEPEPAATVPTCVWIASWPEAVPTETPACRSRLVARIASSTSSGCVMLPEDCRWAVVPAVTSAERIMWSSVSPFTSRITSPVSAAVITCDTVRVPSASSISMSSFCEVSFAVTTPSNGPPLGLTADTISSVFSS